MCGPACGLGTYLFVELDESGLVLLLTVTADVAGVLHMGHRLGHVGLLGHEVLLHLPGKRVQGDGDILSVSDLLELDVGDLLVIDIGGVVCGHVPGEFGEVGGHGIERCKCFCER